MVSKSNLKNKREVSIGHEIYGLINRLFPICRSITGNGVRETLQIIKEFIPIKIHEIPTGTKVFDWIVPKEWNIKDAYIKNSKGNKIIDFKDSNLHIVSYSIPINKKMSLKELKKHLHTLPEKTDWIPYYTTYYKDDWGFCLTHRQYEKLEDDTYEVFIDSSKEKGSLTYGELLIKGESEKEILFTTYICHPSLCNDNLTGPAILTFIAKSLIGKQLKYSYKFLFLPETIGAITWLSQNEKNVSKIKQGVLASCLGDKGMFTYKTSKQKDTEIDKAAEKVLKDSNQKHQILDYNPGSDEKHFCSPAFDIILGTLCRTEYGCFPEYHTSADNLKFIKPEYLKESFKIFSDIIFIIENNKTYINLNPKCEPQLGRRGIYKMLGGHKYGYSDQTAMHWILNFTNGDHSLLDIAIRSKISFKLMKTVADKLEQYKLLEVKK